MPAMSTAVLELKDKSECLTTEKRHELMQIHDGQAQKTCVVAE